MDPGHRSTTRPYTKEDQPLQCNNIALLSVDTPAGPYQQGRPIRKGPTLDQKGTDGPRALTEGVLSENEVIIHV